MPRPSIRPRPMTYVVGDRVIVHPQSRRSLGHLDGEPGTIEAIYTGHPLKGGLLVRLDCDGETLGIGPDAVEPASR